MNLAPGTKLGPYEILSPLGAGGMGEVYRARDTRLDREVAVKVLPQHLSSNPEVRARFEREAKTVSSLNHPHICTLYDVGREGDTDYLVMELIEGETLATRLEKGALPIAETLRIGTEIADALDRAHRAGIVHRDLKPGNVMLTKSGAKLMDFGLARVAGMAPGSSSGASIEALTQSPTMAQPLTAEGTIVGTFQYMSPEQLEGKEADERSDLWALGCVLYEMATGRRAFEGKSQATLITSIMGSQPAPISQIAPMTPPALDRVVRACIAKDAGERIQSAHDVKLQLAWIAEGGSQAGVAAPVARRRRSRERAAWVIAGLAVIAAAASGWLAVRERSAQKPVSAHLALAMPSDAPFQTFRGTQISPDGRTLVFIGRTEDGARMLYTRPIDRNEVTPLAGTNGGFDPFWSPDSRHIGFFADGKLKRIPAAGGPPRVLCDAPTPAGASWGSAGWIVLEAKDLAPLVAVPADGGQPKPVTTMKPADEGHRWPAFLPDGKHFVYLADARRTEDHWLRAGSVDGDVDVPFLQSAVTNVQFAAPDWLFFVRGGSLLAQRFDTGKLQLVGEPVVVGNEVVPSGHNHRYRFSASPSGVVVFRSANPNEDMAWFDREGRRVSTVGKPGRYGEAHLSPDGSRVAYTTRDADGRNDRLLILDIARGVVSDPTAGKGNYFYPVWSPDGEQIMYSGTSGGMGCVYRSSVSGTTREQVIRRGHPDIWASDWSRDGQWFACVDVRDSTNCILAGHADDENHDLRLAEGPLAIEDPCFSPDGHWIAYQQASANGTDVFVQDFPTGKQRYQVSAGGAEWPMWTRDGREIVYQAPDGTVMAAGVRTAGGFSSDAPRKLFRVPASWLQDLSPDGSNLLMIVRIEDPATAPVQVILDWKQEVATR